MSGAQSIRHVVIRGVVQRVGFRAWTEYTAIEHGLEGWVRNRRDGTVEAVVQGHAYDALVAFGGCDKTLPGAMMGLVRPSDITMRNLLVGETMPSELLMRAMGVSRTTADSARVVGALSGAAGVVARPTRRGPAGR